MSGVEDIDGLLGMGISCPHHLEIVTGSGISFMKPQ